MPDAGWAVSRHLPTLARGIEVQIPVSTSVEYVTTRHQRFHGRDAGCPAPPVQIRASPIRALGSYLGCLTAKRTEGQG
jgi:hypothetical protein